MTMLSIVYELALVFLLFQVKYTYIYSVYKPQIQIDEHTKLWISCSARMGKNKCYFCSMLKHLKTDISPASTCDLPMLIALLFG